MFCTGGMGSIAQFPNVYLLKIHRIKNISEGFIQYNTCTSKFKVTIVVDIYNPLLKTKIKTKIKSKILHGFYADEPVETFICDPTSLMVGDEIYIENIKIGFVKGKFVVISKIVN